MVTAIQPNSGQFIFSILQIMQILLFCLQMFDFTEVHNLKTDPLLANLMAITHATWHHSGFTQLCGILELVKIFFEHLRHQKREKIDLKIT